MAEEKRQNLATMGFDELADSLRDRAKTMMANKNVNGAVVFGTLARRFSDAAREIETYSLNEAAIASMIIANDGQAEEWANRKIETLTADAGGETKQ